MGGSYLNRSLALATNRANPLRQKLSNKFLKPCGSSPKKTGTPWKLTCWTWKSPEEENHLNHPPYFLRFKRWIFRGVSLQAALSQNIWPMYQLHLYTPQPWRANFNGFSLAGGPAIAHNDMRKHKFKRQLQAVFCPKIITRTNIIVHVHNISL